jgi:hypothetical protein
MTLVQDLPERDLGGARDVDILRTIADELKKTTAHVVCMILSKKNYLPAKATRPATTRTHLLVEGIARRYGFDGAQVSLALSKVLRVCGRRKVASRNRLVFIER